MGETRGDERLVGELVRGGGERGRLGGVDLTVRGAMAKVRGFAIFPLGSEGSVFCSKPSSSLARAVGSRGNVG